MQVYVHALMTWGLFNYMLHKYDLCITIVCSVILVYVVCTAQMLNVFGKFYLCLYFMSNNLDTDIDIETHDNSHLISTSK